MVHSLCSLCTLSSTPLTLRARTMSISSELNKRAHTRSMLQCLCFRSRFVSDGNTVAEASADPAVWRQVLPLQRVLLWRSGNCITSVSRECCAIFKTTKGCGAERLRVASSVEDPESAGSACFLASRIRIRILPFSEVMLAKQDFKTKL
jgi:hypothetical protein